MQTHIIENGRVITSIMATVEEAQLVFPNALCMEATEGGIGWLWDGEKLTPPAVAVPALLPRITKLAFRNRFTTTEKVMIDLASIDDPAADMAARQQAAAVRVSLADAAAASHIDLSRADTRAGVLMLEAAGILGAGRALEILDAEIQSDERVQ